jgi:hypothetical protein
VLENSQDDYENPRIKKKKIPNDIGGGEIEIVEVLDKYNEVESYSYAYIKDNISLSPIIEYSIASDDNVTSFHYARNPKQMELGKISDDEIRNEFAGYVSQYMGFAQKEGKNMNENNLNQSNALREFMEYTDLIIASISRRRARLAAEAAANLQGLEENTSVNMNPYKDSIQNAETPKQKAAKNKISDLTRK